MLENAADNYDFQVNQKVDALTTLIEPIMIIGMGGVVSYVVFKRGFALCILLPFHL